MRAHKHGRGPGLAAPEAAASFCAAGTASVAAGAVAPAGVNAQKESVPAALKGHVLNRTHGADDPVGLIVTRWGMARELSDSAAMARFLDEVEGAHA